MKGGEAVEGAFIKREVVDSGFTPVRYYTCAKKVHF